MSTQGQKEGTGRNHQKIMALFLMAMGVLVNLCLSRVAYHTTLPLFLDMAGTIFASSLGGYLVGIIVAIGTNLVSGLFHPNAVYYGIINVICAVVTVYFTKKGWMKRKLSSVLSYILVLAFISGTLGSVISLSLSGFASSPRLSGAITFFMEECTWGRSFPNGWGCWP